MSKDTECKGSKTVGFVMASGRGLCPHCGRADLHITRKGYLPGHKP